MYTNGCTFLLQLFTGGAPPLQRQSISTQGSLAEQNIRKEIKTKSRTAKMAIQPPTAAVGLLKVFDHLTNKTNLSSVTCSHTLDITIRLHKMVLCVVCYTIIRISVHSHCHHNISVFIKPPMSFQSIENFFSPFLCHF